LRVGFLAGCLVGEIEGKDDGIQVGCTEGSQLGCKEGWFDG
jgi:hypothetical protein